MKKLLARAYFWFDDTVFCMCNIGIHNWVPFWHTMQWAANESGIFERRR